MLEKKPFARSNCPITGTLDICGDKWTLLVLRDLFVGKKTYNAFTKSPEKIPTNRLAERLKRLESWGLVKKHKYHTKPDRYEYLLTEKGRDMKPILIAMVHWANKHIPDTWIPPESFMREK